MQKTRNPLRVLVAIVCLINLRTWQGRPASCARFCPRMTRRSHPKTGCAKGSKMRALNLLVLILTAGPASKYGAEFTEMPGLTLRGTGCHRELLVRGALLCTAFVRSVPKCHPAMITRDEPDGGIFSERVLLGSSCLPPRLNTGAIGGGSFFVEQQDGGLIAWCDDGEGRPSHREQILSCCENDSKLNSTPACRLAELEK